MRASSATMAGSVISGFLASACCIGPVVFALLGISGAALAHAFAPFRPYLLAVTFALLGGAFCFTYGPEKATCGPGEACEMPHADRLATVVLWIATVVVVLATAFPWYSQYLF